MNLEVGQTLNVTARVVPAVAQIDVEVNANPLQGVNTTTSDLGGVIGANQIDTLGRYWYLRDHDEPGQTRVKVTIRPVRVNAVDMTA